MRSKPFQSCIHTLAFLSFGLCLYGSAGAMAQGYDRVIRPGDVSFEPTGDGRYWIQCIPVVLNGTPDELDMSMELTRSINGQPVDTELVIVTAAGSGSGYTCRGACPGDCSGLPHASECLDLGTDGCSCTIPTEPFPFAAQLNPGDVVGVTLAAANGSAPEVYLDNDSTEVVFGVPAATVIYATSRRTNPSARAFCDTDLHTVPPRKSEPHQGGVQEIRIGFDVAPAGEGSGWRLEQATCTAPNFVPYDGASSPSGSLLQSELVITFAPGLENGRSYRVVLGPTITSISGQSVEVRGLAGDVNSDGQVNAVDRSLVVGAWTGGGFTCPTDLNSDGATNAVDRSLVVGAWTSAQNCAP